MHRKRFAALLIAVPLALGGCSGTDSSPQAPATQAPATATDAAQATPGQEIDPVAFFEKAQKAMTDAKTYSMTVEMDSTGEKTTMTGVGDISDAAHPKADMKLSMPGSAAQMHMIIDGTNVYMQMPGVGGDGKFVRMPLSVLSQAGGQDVSTLMNPSENLALTQQAVDRVVFTGTEDVAGETLRRYKVTMDPQKLQQGLATSGPTAMPSPTGMPESLPYDLWLDDAGRMRKMTMNLEGTAMTMTTTDYGKPVTITPPPAASVTQMPGLSGPATPAPTSAPASPVPASPAPVPTPSGS